MKLLLLILLFITVIIIGTAHLSILSFFFGSVANYMSLPVSFLLAACAFLAYWYIIDTFH